MRWPTCSICDYSSSRKALSQFHKMAGTITRRKLGKTGLELPIIGFGASPLGGVYQVGMVLIEHAAEDVVLLTHQQQYIF